MNEKDLSLYVSNLDKDIYSISNLPEEVIAVIFAFVSRSPKSFRENLLKVTEEKAGQFHEKWVLNFGHASVAELATVHLGIEKVSRLFSAILERSNLYISPIEYSQRYQKPQKGDFYIPPELNEHPALKEEYITVQNAIYDDYHELFQKLLQYYQQNEAKPNRESEKAFLKRIEKYAFEDARYLLTLATFTNLGLTANARAMEDCLIHLLSSEYPEVQQRGEEIKNEVTHSLPTLVKYANANEFLKESRKSLQYPFETIADTDIPDSPVVLLDYTGKNSHIPEENALNLLLTELLFQYGKQSGQSLYKTLEKQDFANKLKLYQRHFSHLGSHDNPHPAFEKINYKAEFNISESCWHQFLRHRKVNFSWQYPTIYNGCIIPPKVKAAQGMDIFLRGLEKSHTLFKKLETISPLLAHYSVTNAHNRRIIGDFSLYELYHLINLRLSPHAQWEIRDMMSLLVEQIYQVHGNLIQPALDRLKT